MAQTSLCRCCARCPVACGALWCLLDRLLLKGSANQAREELDNDSDDEDDELDETLAERLWGLTEMFPERIRSAVGTTFVLSLNVAQKMYRFSRTALWIGTTSFMILILPVVFETEKLQVEQQQQLQQLQQRQILLGPKAALAGGMPGTLTPLPRKV
ncbi:mitochondrial import receptor subunit TOM22 homolog [Gracilinanus agilis]|uniref:mitochondrial import receptor subunit TOM22 homolog n=1 Tax=Gracilinanus agilis TaxID=191870 RepID=UPI001CFE5CD5|nr:mitochondrial import receptor subunit TOM22 homolog [Gracilinanus agilis]